MHTHILLRVDIQTNEIASSILKRYHVGPEPTGFIPSPSFMITSLTLNPQSVKPMVEELAAAGFQFLLLPIMGGGVSNMFLPLVDPSVGLPPHSEVNTEAQKNITRQIVGRTNRERRPQTAEQKLESLKRDLKDAVGDEKYERAREIQNEINSLTSNQST